MFAAAALALLVALALAVARVAVGPTVFDRVLAANTIGTVAMLLLAVLGFLGGRPEFLDLAIVYGLLNVIGTVAVLKFFRLGDLGDPGESDGAVDDDAVRRRGADAAVRGGGVDAAVSGRGVDAAVSGRGVDAAAGR